MECADVTVIAALAVGPVSSLACGGSLALASVAWCAERPVWLVAGEGTVLPAQLFDPMVESVRGRPDPWASGHDVVPHSIVSASSYRGAVPSPPRNSPQCLRARLHSRSSGGAWSERCA